MKDMDKTKGETTTQTYVIITLVYPFFFGSSTEGHPSNKKSYKYGNFSPIWIGEFIEEISF